MDEDRYGKPSRLPALLIGLPIGLFLLASGAYLTLVSWGVLGDEESKSLSIIGPLTAGFGVALLYVALRPRHRPPGP